MKQVFASLAFALVCFGSFAQTFPANSGLVATAATTGSAWTAPVGAVFSKDGMLLFVWEKRGRVYVCTRNAAGVYVKQETPVLNISEEVGDWRDFGLLGFALDPMFESTGRIYLLYVVDRHYLMNKDHGMGTYNAATNLYYAATIGRVSRYTVTTSGSNLLAGSRKVLLGETKHTGIPILHESHGVGGLAFAADGTLLLSAGDGASYSTTDAGSIEQTYYVQAMADGIIRTEENVGAFRSQMLNSHNGKLLRINPENGNGISSNPFYDAANPRSPKSRVWALGLRNPFRISVRPGSGSTNPSAGDIGEVFIGDVGWNVWEELNVAKAPGMNFGWPLYEGHTLLASYNAKNTQNPDEANPLYNTGACGRPYYRFNELLTQDNAAKNNVVLNPCDPSIQIGAHNRNIHARPAMDWKHLEDITRVGKYNAAGEAIAVTVGQSGSDVEGTPFKGNSSSGGIWYSGTANRFPAAYNNTFIMADYGGKWIKRLTMDYTDVVTKVEGIATGAGAVLCLAENPIDGSIFYIDYATVKKISFGGNMPPVVKAVSDKTYGPSSLAVSFDGSGSYDPTHSGSIVSYAWDFGDPSSGANNTSSALKPAHTFTAPAGTPKKYTVKLTVTDNGGASATDSIIISVNNTPPAASIVSPVKNSKYRIATDTTYSYSAVVTDSEHSSAQMSYAWQTTLRHNNHEHPEAIDPVQETEGRISRIGCNGDNYYWLIELTVTDAAGLSAKDSSKIFPDCVGTLPIFLHKFSVNQQAASNIVKWSTQLESNMEYFEVERSTDGINFQAVNRQSSSNTSGINEYSFVDHAAPAGISYYRLKMVEHGAIIRYSIIVKTVSVNEQLSLKIAPNPVVDNFSITYHSTQNGTAMIQVKDLTGKSVQTLNEAVHKGNNLIYLQNLSTWKPGLYFVSVHQDGVVQHGKFVKVGK